MKSEIATSEKQTVNSNGKFFAGKKVSVTKCGEIVTRGIGDPLNHGPLIDPFPMGALRKIVTRIFRGPLFNCRFWPTFEWPLIH